jgi:hypothetical protein
VFGRRKREEEAAAEAAREAERRALFAKLAERPEHVCPFLGLESERTEYVEGISDEHRCFAFGDPAPISAEQQTRVCQERGYGNCPRYLRGVLVIPTEELEALRRPRAPMPEAPPPSPAASSDAPASAGPASPPPAARRSAGGAGAFFLFGDDGTAIGSPSPTPLATPVVTPSPEPSPSPSPSPTLTASPSPTPAGTGPATPTPEPTPTAGDTFAFYEVSVGPEGYTLYQLSAGGNVVATRGASFANFSFAAVEPVEAANGDVYWVTQDGGLQGWAYTYPQSGNFRIRAVFLSPTASGARCTCDEDDLAEFPESTPAP